MRPLVIIEPLTTLSADIRSALHSAGFDAEPFDDAAAALSCLRRKGAALAIIDLDRHDTDVFAVCREASRIVPVIALTSERGEEICLRAFDSGADDCVCRPVAGRELVARVRNVLRRVDSENRPSDELLLATRAMRVSGSNGLHELTRGETQVLELLLSYAPAPLTASQMAAALKVKRGTLESRIKSLRKKLGPDRLVSRGKLGYQLVG